MDPIEFRSNVKDVLMERPAAQQTVNFPRSISFKFKIITSNSNYSHIAT